MKIRTIFDRFRCPAPSPTGKAKIFEERLNSDGVMELVQTGSHDLNEFVQASLEGSKVYSLLDRFAKTQDPSIFNVSTGFFADVSDMPSDLMSAQNMILSIDKKFASLPVDIKEKFDNSPQKFYAAYMDGSIVDVLGENAQKIGDQISSAEADPAQKVGEN